MKKIKKISHKFSLSWVLFFFSLIIYSFTRLYALDRFPIYFFADEAFHTLKAEELIKSNLRSPDGTIFPIYFEAAALRFTPALPVYLQMIPLMLFGKSVIATRGTSALIAIFGCIAVSLILKSIFKIRLWWTIPLIMALIPAWLLHSRTGFETSITTSFYAIFLLFYLLYRNRSAFFLPLAIFFGAATFYTYSNAQIIMLVLGISLFISDIKYHLFHWKIFLIGVIFSIFLAMPLINFQKNHPSQLPTHLRMINSYLFQRIPIQKKINMFVQKYSYGLSYQYWFQSENEEMIRHRIKNFGHIRMEFLPFILIGLSICLWNIKTSRYRTILLSILAVPTGASLLDIGITRVLPMVIPISILTCLGLYTVMSRIINSIRKYYYPVIIILFLILSVSGLNFFKEILVNSPYWYRDYGLYGMQWGAKQLFSDFIPAYLAKDPQVKMKVSSTWANGTDNFLNFFLNSEQKKRVEMRTIDMYLFNKQNLDLNSLFIMTPQEYQKAKESGKFKTIKAEQILPYPDISPGFYFVRFEYKDDVDDIFAKDIKVRRKPVADTLRIDDQTIIIVHSRLDIGPLGNIIDDDPFTLIRGQEANPFIFEFNYPKPTLVSKLLANFGSMDNFTVTISLYPASDSKPRVFEKNFRGLKPDPQIDMPFDKDSIAVSKIRLEIKNNLLPVDSANIHIRELKFM